MSSHSIASGETRIHVKRAHTAQHLEIICLVLRHFGGTVGVIMRRARSTRLAQVVELLHTLLDLVPGRCACACACVVRVGVWGCVRARVHVCGRGCVEEKQGSHPIQVHQ